MLSTLAKQIRDCDLFNDEKDDFLCVKKFANEIGHHTKHDKPPIPQEVSSNQIIVKFLTDIYTKRAEKVAEHKELCEIEFKNFKALFIKYSQQDPKLMEFKEIFNGETQSLINLINGPSGLLTTIQSLYLKTYVPIHNMTDGAAKKEAFAKSNLYFERVGNLIARLFDALYDTTGKILIIKSTELEKLEGVDVQKSITEKDCDFSDDLLPIFYKFEKIFKFIECVGPDIKSSLLTSLREIIKQFSICVAYYRLPVILSRQQQKVFNFNTFYGSIPLGPLFLKPYGVDPRSIAIIPSPFDV